VRSRSSSWSQQCSASFWSSNSPQPPKQRRLYERECRMRDVNSVSEDFCKKRCENPQTLGAVCCRCCVTTRTYQILRCTSTAAAVARAAVIRQHHAALVDGIAAYHAVFLLQQQTRCSQASHQQRQTWPDHKDSCCDRRNMLGVSQSPRPKVSAKLLHHTCQYRVLIGESLHGVRQPGCTGRFACTILT
jgi:hypothetical protein